MTYNKFSNSQFAFTTFLFCTCLMFFLPSCSTSRYSTSIPKNESVDDLIVSEIPDFAGISDQNTQTYVVKNIDKRDSILLRVISGKDSYFKLLAKDEILHLKRDSLKIQFAGKRNQTYEMTITPELTRNEIKIFTIDKYLNKPNQTNIWDIAKAGYNTIIKSNKDFKVFLNDSLLGNNDTYNLMLREGINHIRAEWNNLSYIESFYVSDKEMTEHTISAGTTFAERIYLPAIPGYYDFLFQRYNSSFVRFSAFSSGLLLAGFSSVQLSSDKRDSGHIYSATGLSISLAMIAFSYYSFFFSDSMPEEIIVTPPYKREQSVTVQTPVKIRYF